MSKRIEMPLLILAIFGGLAMCALALGAGNPDTYNHALRLFGIQALSQPFGDLHSVLGAWDCVRRGLDVYQANPCERAFNYPPAWLFLAPLGFGVASINSIGLGMTILTILSFSALFAEIPLRQALIVLPALFCPTVLVLLERGNVDIICFLLLFASGWLLDRGGDARAGVAGLLCAFATALKLFPIAAITLATIPAKRFRIAAVLLLVFGSAAIAYTVPWFSEIARNTEYGIISDYGYQAGFWRMETYLNGDRTYLETGTAAMIGTHYILIARLALLGAIGAAAVLASHWRKQGILLALSEDRQAAWYLMGAAVFVCTFMLGINWAYRLVFLVLCLPGLLLWAAAKPARGQTFPNTILILILTLLWLERLHRYTWGMEHAVSYVLFVLLLAHLFVLALDAFRTTEKPRVRQPLCSENLSP